MPPDKMPPDPDNVADTILREFISWCENYTERYIDERVGLGIVLAAEKLLNLCDSYGLDLYDNGDNKSRHK